MSNFTYNIFAGTKELTPKLITVGKPSESPRNTIETIQENPNCGSLYVYLGMKNVEESKKW